jgi:succinate dehydrogenase / fumarate reductase membrane anchor subunit
MNVEDDRKQRGMFSWLLQRVSGIFLAYAVIVHLWTVHYVHADRLTWETITGRLQEGASWTIYYLLFIPVVLYHAFNGIWGIVLDYAPSPPIRRFWAIGIWIIGLALVTYGYFGLKSLLN